MGLVAPCVIIMLGIGYCICADQNYDSPNVEKMAKYHDQTYRKLMKDDD